MSVTFDANGIHLNSGTTIYASWETFSYTPTWSGDICSYTFVLPSSPVYNIGTIILVPFKSTTTITLPGDLNKVCQFYIFPPYGQWLLGATFDYNAKDTDEDDYPYWNTSNVYPAIRGAIGYSFILPYGSTTDRDYSYVFNKNTVSRIMLWRIE